MDSLKDMMSTTVSIITNDGRHVVGLLKGVDKSTNLVVAQAHERVYSRDKPLQKIPLGLYIVRGDNVSVVGALDVARDAELNLDGLRADPMPPVVQKLI